MDDKTKQACIDYINAHARELHGLGVDKNGRPANVTDHIGRGATIEDIHSARIDDDEGVVLVNRGIKGISKYRLSLEAVADEAKGSTAKAVAKAIEPVEAKGTTKK